MKICLLVPRVGQSFSQKPGDVIDVPADEAGRLVQSEQARYVDEPPAVEPEPEPVAPREITDAELLEAEQAADGLQLTKPDAIADELPPFEPDPPADSPEPVTAPVPQPVPETKETFPVKRPRFG